MRDTAQRLTDADYQAMASFRYALRRFLRFSENVTRQAGMTPRHYQLLLAIRGNPERQSLTISEIAEQLQIEHHSAVELVDRAADRGLVLRLRGVEDRRERYVGLTPTGGELLEELAGMHRDELRRLRRSLLELEDREGELVRDR